jgi:hypothetical protein
MERMEPMPIQFDPNITDAFKTYAHQHHKFLRVERRLEICSHCSRAIPSGCLDRTHEELLVVLLSDRPGCKVSEIIVDLSSIQEQQVPFMGCPDDE